MSAEKKSEEEILSEKMQVKNAEKNTTDNTTENATKNITENMTENLVNKNTAETDELAPYDYELPDELIAQSPLKNRSDARMMVINREQKTIEHRYVRDILEYIRPNDCLVLNNTKVLPARLIGFRTETNGRWEGLFLNFSPEGVWELMSKTRGKLHAGETITLETPEGKTGFQLKVLARTPNKTVIVQPLTEDDSFTALDKVGWVPIPPYIRHGRMIPSDKENYQTVYARHPGAVAAPTAGLHFTPLLLRKIQDQGSVLCPVTLHVGAGTFKPITSARLSEHPMHSEFANISSDAVQTIKAQRALGGRIVAVGTTSVRTLESASHLDEQGIFHQESVFQEPYRNELKPFRGQTNLFIRPPYQFRSTDAMLTNFHLPKSTLLILVRTFGGDELLRFAYQEAVAERYRFYSYGDAMLIL